MKTSSRTLTLVSTAFAALCLALASFGAQAFELRGFRGVHWGEGVDALRGTTLVQTDGDVACHQRETENLLFGDTALSGVRYCFHHDRLVMVMLDAPVARETLSAEFQRAYGQPNARSARAEVWGGVPSIAQAQLVSQGAHAARLVISVSRIEPEAARRMAKLADSDTPHRVASAY